MDGSRPESYDIGHWYVGIVIELHDGVGPEMCASILYPSDVDGGGWKTIDPFKKSTKELLVANTMVGLRLRFKGRTKKGATKKRWKRADYDRQIKVSSPLSSSCSSTPFHAILSIYVSSLET